jgi:hypothetical protein
MTLGGCAPTAATLAGARMRVDSAQRTTRLTFTGPDTRDIAVRCR